MTLSYQKSWLDDLEQNPVEQIGRYITDTFELRRCQRYVKADLVQDKGASSGLFKE